MEAQLYQIDYRQANGSIESDETKYCRAEWVEDVFLNFIENNSVNEYLIDDYAVTIVNSKQKDNTIYCQGEVLDNISKGGQWSYFDVAIKPIKLEAVFVRSEVTLKELEAFDLASLKATFNKPIISNAKPEWEAYLNSIGVYRRS